MPNWVFSTMSIHADESIVAEIQELLAKPYETNHKEFVINDDGTQGYKQTKGVHESDLSFWNIVSPTDLDAYYGEQYKTDLNNFAESYQKAMEESNHWYEWNIRNWGCKWDASEVDIIVREQGLIVYKFETAWSAPLAAIGQLSLMYPAAVIGIRWEEEQGFGEELEYLNGEYKVLEEWDIPDSHEDEMRQREHCWNCESLWYDESKGEWDFSSMYDDCPRPTDEELDRLLKQQRENNKWLSEQKHLTNTDVSATIAQEVF